MTNEAYKIPRLYTNAPLSIGALITLQDQTHYIRNVMRTNAGDNLRLFNGQDGEWLCEITDISKKQTTLRLTKQLRQQPPKPHHIHLIFAPIKKNRMDMLIEKAVELGASHLHPIITDHTQNPKIKQERLEAQMLEAAEQSERLDMPRLSTLTHLKDKITNWDKKNDIIWCAERDENAPLLEKMHAPATFLIGPEGGFSDVECDFLEAQSFIKPVSLGEHLLRAETAAIYCLSHIHKKT